MNKGIKAVQSRVEAVMAVMLIAALTVAGCGGGGDSGEAIAAGDTVSVKYRLTLDDGSVADSSLDSNPLEFVAGQGQMIQGFDNAVLGMKTNEEKSFTVPPEEAYGSKDPNAVHNFSREGLPEGFVPEMGMMLHLNGPTGPVPAKVVGITEDSLALDLNHPMAGENLNFAIKVIKIAKGPAPSQVQ